MKKVHVWVASVVAAFVVLVGGAAAAYAVHFDGRALPGVSVAGVSVSGMAREEIIAAVDQRAADLAATVTVAGSRSTTALADAGVTVDAEATADAALAWSESVSSRFQGLFSSHEVPAVVTVDEDAFTSYADGLSAEAGTPMVNAGVTLADDGASFVVTEAQTGVSVDEETLRAALVGVSATLTSVDAEVPTSEQEPAVSTERATEVAGAANALVAHEVSISDGEKTHSASAADRASWIDVPATDDSLGDPTWNADRVRAWVEATAQSTNVEARPGVKNVNSRGDVVSIHDPGVTGWAVNNASTVADELLTALNEGQSYSGDFDYDKTEPEFSTRLIADGADGLAYQAAPGEKWVDIDLSSNTVSAYEGATIVKGPIPMVPGAPQTPTVTGVFHVYLKYASQTMRGTNVDGTPYVTENVPWVTYFTGSYALHGAPWRSSFGWSGNGGSHGCVNMPVDGAKWFYDWATIGTTVVSHY